tara:strand:- start:5488 stop:5694 length:207 start_codon:yes stop_codon:yes gene_type:complete
MAKGIAKRTRKVWTDKEVYTIQKEYSKGATVPEIMSKYSLTKHQVHHALYTYEFKGRPKGGVLEWLLG